MSKVGATHLHGATASGMIREVFDRRRIMVEMKGIGHRMEDTLERFGAAKYAEPGRELAKLFNHPPRPPRRKPNWCWHCFRPLGHVVYRREAQKPQRYHRLCYGREFNVEMFAKGTA